MRSWSWIALLAAGLVACTSGSRGQRRPSESAAPQTRASRDDPLPSPKKNDVGKIPGTPSIRVVWEALYVEQERFRDSKYRPSDLTGFGGEPDLEVVLLGASFVATPEQDRENRGQVAVGRIARVPDQDMIDLVREFDRLGFFRYARPTASVRPYFASDRARGRITVDRDGESVTIVSQRGLGLQESTKEIPAIYAAAKDAIQRLKNRSPSMSVKRAKVDPADPDAMRRSGVTGGGGR